MSSPSSPHWIGNGARHETGAFTLVEMLVVIAIIAILSALLAPSINRAMASANAAKCQSNMRQVSLACLSFTADNDGRLPPLYTYKTEFPTESAADGRIMSNPAVVAWPDIVRSYLPVGSAGSKNSIFSCPSLKTPATVGTGGMVCPNDPMGIGINFGYAGVQPASIFVIRGEFQTIIGVKAPSRTVLFSDVSGAPGGSGGFSTRRDLPNMGAIYFCGYTETGDLVMPRHGGKANVSFVDGHAVAVDPAGIDWGSRDPSFADAVGWCEVNAER